MAISILSVLNFLLPKDSGSQAIARDVTFGDLPRHKLDIYAPRLSGRPPKGGLPVVVFIYGGSWAEGERGDYEFVGRALAAQGFVTVVADYRLVPEVEYPGFLEDCALAFAWVIGNIARHGGDPQRIALMGHSAGAYNAAMLALDPAYLGRAGLLAHVRCVVGLSGPYDFFPFDGAISMRTFGAVAEPMLTQPVHFVAPGAPPMLLATGERDGLVYPRNTVELARRLRVVGVAVEERHYPGLGHPGPLLALARPLRGLAPVLKEVVDYLERHLQPAVRPAPVTVDAEPQ
ncbi:MAG: alpha/beta hydrolase [Alphaproteobacteria bacterium]|nr:alpha/beta hydrolase [Alphaproteobacteria bacterium]